MTVQVTSPTHNRHSGFHQVSNMEHTVHDESSIYDSTATMTTINLTKRPNNRKNPLQNSSLTNSISPIGHISSSAGENTVPQNSVSGSHDRFIPRATCSSIQRGELAEACGISTNRILEFSSAPPMQRKFAAADFISQYSQHRPVSRSSSVASSRQIQTKPVRILDAPGLVDDFYANVIDWSGALDCMAIGLGSTVYCWDPKTSGVSVIAELDPEGTTGITVSSLSWSNEDTCICIANSRGEVQIWDAGTGSLVRTMRGRNCGRVAALSWNEPLVSSGGRDGSVWNHDVRIKRHKVAELRAHSGEVCGLTWRKDGRMLASGGNDNLVNLWDCRVTSVPKHQLAAHQAAVKALSWSPWHTNLLATGGGSADKQIHLWNATSGHCINSIDAGAQVTSLHWNEEYRELAATLGYPSNSIAVWSHPTLSKQTEIVNAHDSRILSGALSSDGQTLVTCSADENIKFWNLFETNSKKNRKSNQNIQSLGFGSSFALGRV